MNWINKIPPFDSQFSNGVDAFDCVEESLCHIIYMLTGFRASPRALGYLLFRDGKLTTNGSAITDAVLYANKFGLIPYESWPTPDSFTWDSYYAPLPPETLLHAKFFNISLIDPDLNKSPIWQELSFPGRLGSTFHWVAKLNELEYFDSEPHGAVKPLIYGGAVELSSHSIKIKPMPQFKTQNYKGELRIVLQADSEQTWEALCKVYSVDPKVINETI